MDVRSANPAKNGARLVFLSGGVAFSSELIIIRGESQPIINQELAGARLGVTSAMEGFPTSYVRSANFERHVMEFINNWQAEPILNDYITRRMEQLGIKLSAIGIIDDTEAGSAFSAGTFQGGRNAVVGRFPAAANLTKGGIHVDAGVFDSALEPTSPSWASASLRDRIDAVIVHEYLEYQSNLRFGARHLDAISLGPSTNMPVSEGALRILQEKALFTNL